MLVGRIQVEASSRPKYGTEVFPVRQTSRGSSLRQSALTVNHANARTPGNLAEQILRWTFRLQAPSLLRMTENVPPSADGAQAPRPDLKTFGGRLTHALLLSNTRNIELARAIGISPQAVAKLCRISAPRTSSRRIPEIAAHLQVSLEWLAYGLGPGPTEEGLTTSEAVTQSDGVQATTARFRLTALQAATLDKLEALMAGGTFDDLDCLELLTDLKPKLAALCPHG